MFGTSIAQYRITAKLGEGGMGEVYRGRDTKLGSEVAIKVLPAGYLEKLKGLEPEVPNLRGASKAIAYQ